jgi:hypothetical protein
MQNVLSQMPYDDYLKKIKKEFKSIYMLGKIPQNAINAFATMCNCCHLELIQISFVTIMHP